MSKVILTIRQKNIITMLVNQYPDAMTTSDIAKNLDLSERTVKRDLNQIEEWFDLNDFSLSKKPGVGIMIDEPPEMISFIKEILEVENFQKTYDKDERIKFILSRLLVSREPIKSFLFLNYLKISDKTLSSDLNDIEQWMSPFNLKLIKKPGEGISIEGRERAIRAAQINLIYDTYDENKRLDLMEALSEISTKNNRGNGDEILSILDRDIVNRVKGVLNSIFSEFDMDIADNSYIGLLVHISIAISRISSGEKISMERDFFDTLRNTKEFMFAKLIVKRLENEFDIAISDYEAGYITMHIRGAKFANSFDESSIDEEAIEIFRLSESLIFAVEGRLNMNLHRDSRLQVNLKQHLLPAVSRIRMNMRIQNPILDEIKNRFTYLFRLIDEEFPRVLKSELGDDVEYRVPDDEIGYLTIHFASAIERLYKDNVNINAVVACPTGIGTSVFLRTRLENTFNRINVVDNVSVVNIKNALNKYKNVDLIVSTVDISNSIKRGDIPDDTKSIVVSPLLAEDDVMKLNVLFNEISRHKLNEYTRCSIAGKRPREIFFSSDTEENIQDNFTDRIKTKLKNTGTGVLRSVIDISHVLSSVIDEVKFLEVEYSPADEVNRMCIDFANEISDEPEYRNMLVESLKKRNEIQVPYFEEYHLLYLHSEIDIPKPHLGFAKGNGDEISIIALIPKNKSSYIKEYFSEISIAIIENPDLLDSIRRQDYKNVIEILYNIVEQLIIRNID